MSEFQLVGSTLSSNVARACGVCGQIRRLSKTHVPPQAAGNTGSVERAGDVIENGVRRPGRWSIGGMWVRGLCVDCNSRAGTYYDLPYADFAAQLAILTSPTAQRLALIPGEAPGVRFAPGLVARSVLYGMFAINPHLRVLFPKLAGDLYRESPGEGPIRWPDQLHLRVGRSHPHFLRDGVLASGVWAMRVDRERVAHPTFGDIVFPPLTWSLTPSHVDTEKDRLGPQITSSLGDATHWTRYGPDRTSVDLRSLIRSLPALAHPMIRRTNDWVELVSNDGSDAAPVIVFGRRP